ncbi:MAG: hypothetical protein R3Y59_05250 [bacterium]
MNDENIEIKWEEIDPSAVNSKIYDDTLYDSLYDELLTKCNPANFINSNYSKDNIIAANSLYRNLIDNPDTEQIELRNIRNQAEEKLGITFSTAHIFQYLLEATNPQHFTGINYHSKLLLYSNNLYSKILEAKCDIVQLEELYFEYIDVFRELKLYNNRDCELLLYREELKIRDEKKKIATLKADEEMNKTTAIVVIISLIILTCIALIIDSIYKLNYE